MFEDWGLGGWIKFTVCAVLGTQILTHVLKPWILNRGNSAPLPPGKLAWPFWDDTIEYVRSMKGFYETGKWIDERRARHGNIFKARVFLVPTVFALGPKANRFVLSNDTTLFGNIWPKSMRELLGASSILLASGEQHRRMRMHMEQFLGTDAIKRFVSTMEAYILQLLDRWEGEDVVEVYNETHHQTFKIACGFMLGGSKDVDVRMLGEKFDYMGKNIFCLPINLPWTQYGKSLKARSAIHKVIYSEIRKRRAEWELGLSPLGEGGRLSSRNIDLARDLLDLFMFWEVNPDCGKKWEFNDIEIAENIAVALFASHGTTTSVFSSILYLLVTRPHIIQGIRKDCRAVADSKKPGEPITWADTRKLQYIRKVIYETLRVHTTIAQITKQALSDIEFEGYKIPKGWAVTLCGRQTHSKDEHFPEADVFDPNRFDEKPDLYSYIPFSRGARMCPGDKFAMVLLQTFLYHFIPRFDYELVNPDEEFSMFLAPAAKKGLLIKLKPRNTARSE